METKEKAKPLSREEREAKKVKIDFDEFLDHIDVQHNIGLRKSEGLKKDISKKSILPKWK